MTGGDGNCKSISRIYMHWVARRAGMLKQRRSFCGVWGRRAARYSKMRLREKVGWKIGVRMS